VEEVLAQRGLAKSGAVTCCERVARNFVFRLEDILGY